MTSSLGITLPTLVVVLAAAVSGAAAGEAEPATLPVRADSRARVVRDVSAELSPRAVIERLPSTRKVHLVSASQDERLEPALPPVELPLAELQLAITPPPGEFPADAAAERFDAAPVILQGMGASRPVPEAWVHWEAAALATRPLYFEEVNLERHGYSIGLLQPVASAAHFFGRVPLLPYLVTVDRPRDVRYPLGHYRPGDCVPYQWHVPPVRGDATLVEAAVAAGAILAFP